MKTPQALLTAIAAAALSFAVVIGTAATMASEQDAATTSASVVHESAAGTTWSMAYMAQANAAGWNVDCEFAL